jgi:hypothetical protein
VKQVTNKRVRGRRVLLVLASRLSPRRPGTVALTLAGAAVGATAYLVHRVGKRSGVTNEEMNADLPGDELVTQPMWGSTRAITIDAPVEEVWPWIVQMGFPTHRAGWYTPYVLDRLTFGIRERSASQIRPELQRIEVGDAIPDSADGRVFFTVVEVQPSGALVLHSTRHVIKPMRTIEFSWAFVLRKLDKRSTRLLIRARTNFTPRWARLFSELVIGPADFLNVVAMLHGIKRRAEGEREAVSTTRLAPAPGLQMEWE